MKVQHESRINERLNEATLDSKRCNHTTPSSSEWLRSRLRDLTGANSVQPGNATGGSSHNNNFDMIAFSVWPRDLSRHSAGGAGKPGRRSQHSAARRGHDDPALRGRPLAASLAAGDWTRGPCIHPRQAWPGAAGPNQRGPGPGSGRTLTASSTDRSELL